MRTKLAEVMTYRAFQKLSARVQETQKFPENAKIKTTQFFSGKKTNLLTGICVYWLRSEGYFAQRNNTTGTPRKMPDGSVKWTPATGMKGSSDIVAIGNGGRSLFVEIKYGRDRVRPAQEKFQEAVTAQGADYVIVKRFDDLIEYLKQ